MGSTPGNLDGADVDARVKVTKQVNAAPSHGMPPSLPKSVT
jgi:hypothetical protein